MSSAINVEYEIKTFLQHKGCVEREELKAWLRHKGVAESTIEKKLSYYLKKIGAIVEGNKICLPGEEEKQSSLPTLQATLYTPHASLPTKLTVQPAVRILSLLTHFENLAKQQYNCLDAKAKLYCDDDNKKLVIEISCLQPDGSTEKLYAEVDDPKYYNIAKNYLSTASRSKTSSVEALASSTLS